MREMLLAFDIGTGGTKAALYDRHGTAVAESFQPYPTSYPAAGWHEQRPADWWDAVRAGWRDLADRHPGAADGIVAIGLSGQSLAAVPLDAQGNLLAESVPIWSDTRATAQAQRFLAEVGAEAWYLRTGNGFPAPHYTLFKLMWLRDNAPEQYNRIHTVLGSKDFINYRLTGALATDHSYASGLGGYALTQREYDPQLLAAAGVPPGFLPPIVPASHVVGVLHAAAAAALGLPTGIPVVAGGVDNACMAAGAGCVDPGNGYCSLGSSNWLTVAGTEPVLDPATRPFVFDHIVPDRYISALSTFGGGSTVAWVREQILSTDASYDELMALAATAPLGAAGLLCVPTLAGGTVLEGGPMVRGALVGLDLGHTRAHVCRAVLEGVALALRRALDALDTLTADQPATTDILLVGGGSRGAQWRQILADVFNRPVRKTTVDQQAATLGAAAAAAVGIGLWPDWSTAAATHQETHRHRPDPSTTAAYDRLRAAFEVASAQQRDLAPYLAAVRGS